MKRRILLTLLAVVLATAATGQSTAKRAAADSAPAINLALDLATRNAIPDAPDDPLLDANGAVVLDSFGKPMSAPNETFHKVIPEIFDPGHTFLVQSAWLDGIGCPTSQTFPNALTGMNDTYADSGCPSGDPKDSHNEGLLMAKTGPTANNASAEAQLKKVRGISPLFELGYDIRKSVGEGSHCDNGSPRFDVITTDGNDHFVGCASPAPLVTATSPGWQRLRWTTAQLAAAFPPISPSETVQRIDIVFDDGQTGTAFPFGAAILDNIDVNGTIVGRGKSGHMPEDQSKDDDDDD
jgi:hypothetical protein